MSFSFCVFGKKLFLYAFNFLWLNHNKFNIFKDKRYRYYSAVIHRNFTFLDTPLSLRPKGTADIIEFGSTQAG